MEEPARMDEGELLGPVGVGRKHGGPTRLLERGHGGDRLSGPPRRLVSATRPWNAQRKSQHDAARAEAEPTPGALMAHLPPVELLLSMRSEAHDPPDSLSLDPPAVK